MTDELDIPESAFRVKSDYKERPSREIVGLIKEFIDRFGTPHLWWGHTHTKPEGGSRVTFLAKYGLPKNHHRREKWAPCPCCSPRHPKYFRHGLVAWFPDEGVIRCVGDQCYKKMDPAGYDLAMKQLNAEIESERNTEYLLARIPLIPQFLRTIDANMPTVVAIDAMRNRLVGLLDRTLAIDLWPHINSGVLQKLVFLEEIRRGRSGIEEVHVVPQYVDYGSVPGHIALKPGRSTLSSRLDARRKNLSVIDFGSETATRIVAMTEPEKQSVAKILSWAHKEANRLIAEALLVRRFFHQDSLATVNGWAQHENCPVGIHFILTNDGLGVGRFKDDAHSHLSWPANFWNVLTELELLAKASIAA